MYNKFFLSSENPLFLALDLDYDDLRDYLKDLTLLVSRITHSEVSLVNLIDAYTQWTVADKGLDIREILGGHAASESGTDGEIGYGFGLNLVRHLVDQAGGRMDLQSKPGARHRIHRQIASLN